MHQKIVAQHRTYTFKMFCHVLLFIEDGLVYGGGSVIQSMPVEVRGQLEGASFHPPKI